MQSNPQIPDKNRIYPGQILNVPTTIGPPILPPVQKKPSPQPNVPDLPFIPGLIIPSLQPTPYDATVQEVYTRYAVVTSDMDRGPGSAGARIGENIMKSDLPPMPWSMVRQTRGVALGHSISTKRTVFASHRALRNSGPIESALGIRYFGDWIVVRYHYLQQDPDDGPGFTPPLDQDAFTALYNSGTQKNPPESQGE